MTVKDLEGRLNIIWIF